ncbi:oxidoreductase [Mycolicibacterium agri]|uniref:Carboxylic acid reductase n=1 Tax=Mycolicibacterium agri TaxID=36811 RepID=A0A2A7NH78_MYCAG|nr:carboxylic acid reductase [Mycolicibacterium agri]PEG43067.1 oxidoreductase [Mycolicibacterium agri]GFG54553.1 oxidoreductase [Mycolicibacterium agri]
MNIEDRIAGLYANDPQFAAARPDPAVLEAASQPGLRLTEALQTLVEGYADRPALGQRARELVTDPQTGRTSARLLPHFETVSYRELWERVAAVATALRNDAHAPVNPGDFVATIGFASPDYFTVDLACAYLGLVSVPLQHNAPVSQLRPIIDETAPKVIAVSAEYLELGVESALPSKSLRHLLVFDFDPDVDDHRDAIERARIRFRDAGKPVVVDTLDRVVEQGTGQPTEPPFTAGSDDRLAMILYTSGSTGTPKGAMLTERTVKMLFTSEFIPRTGHAVFNVNFMPLNHVGGRLPIASAFKAGGTSYFVAESDLSTLFEDWALVRPTDMALVPRVIDMLFQRYRSSVDRILAEGATEAKAEASAAAELREHVLGGRVLGGFVSTAPLAAEMKRFIDSVLQVHITDAYGTTEVGGVMADGVISRPPVIDYKLVDVPELGYFHTDKPYPRGELRVKTTMVMPGYYKRPDVNAEVFDEDGYYRTGDVMAEIEPDTLVYVDRTKNVLKLSQGEFVAVSNVEAIFAGAPLVRQIYVYGNSERSNLLAVIVPTHEALDRFGANTGALRAALADSLRETARVAQLQSYEVPTHFFIETEPFTAANGLLSGVGKNLRPRLKERYGERLEQLYTELAAARVDELHALRHDAANRPVLETVVDAAQAVLGMIDIAVSPDDHFTDLGGDSLSALTFGNLLRDIFGVDVPVGSIVGPTSDLRQIATFIQSERESGSKRPTFASVHGENATSARASDLTLDKFIDAETLATAPSIAYVTGEPKTVLLTGANGWLGRFLALELLQRAAQTGGTVITLVRGRDEAAARARLEAAFDSGDPLLLKRFHGLAENHLEVIAGDIGEQNLGLDRATWDRLANNVDQIIHPAALVNHVLPYSEFFGPNVVGTAEIIRLAITAQIKPVTYLSTVAVAMSVAAQDFVEDGDIREVSPLRPVDSSYANGYANSKWAGEVLLREAHDLCGLPVAVFRADQILAHTRYTGQLNVPDSFTRLLQSLILTGLAPGSFYERDADGRPQRAHYDGLPVDFVAEAIVKLSATSTDGFRSFDVNNPHDDGVSLDTFVDWLIAAGRDIARIDDYDDWLQRFETALTALPEEQRRRSVLPLLDAYRKPERPIRGGLAPAEVFHAAVRDAGIGLDGDIPHITESLIGKYSSDLEHLGMV